MYEVLGPPINPTALKAFEANPVGCTLAGGERVPHNILAEAQSIVAAHRPPGLPVGFEPVCMALSLVDFQSIDHLVFRRMSPEEQQEHLAVLREEYKDDPEAQIEILKHDPESEFYKKHRALMAALQGGDEVKCAELETWFNENYPGVEI